MDIDAAFEQVLHGDGVADGNGIANEEDAGQSGDISDGGKGGIGCALGFGRGCGFGGVIRMEVQAEGGEQEEREGAGGEHGEVLNEWGKVFYLGLT